MDVLRGYILSAVAAAVLCAVVNGLIGKKSTNSAAVKMLTGLFLAVTVLAPWVDFRLTDLGLWTADVGSMADVAVAQGEEMAQDALASIIKRNTEAYILDKAASMALKIEVEVMLGSTNPPLPDKVYLKGAVSPYAKGVLSQSIALDLGIPEEKQIWT